jgi:hypothetical protein
VRFPKGRHALKRPVTAKRFLAFTFVLVVLASCGAPTSTAISKAFPSLAPALPSPTASPRTAADQRATKIARTLDPKFKGDATWNNELAIIDVDPRWDIPANCKGDPGYSGSGVDTVWCGKNHVSMWDTMKSYLLPNAVAVTGNWRPTSDCQLFDTFVTIFAAKMYDGPFFNIYQCNEGVVAAPSGLGSQDTTALRKEAQRAKVHLDSLYEPNLANLPPVVQAALNFSSADGKSIFEKIEAYCDGTATPGGTAALPGSVWYRDGPDASTYVLWHIGSCSGNRGVAVSPKISGDLTHMWWLNPDDYLDTASTGG